MIHRRDNLFTKIATREGIKVSQEDLNIRIVAMARRYQMTPDKFAKELEKRDGVREIYSQMLNEKVVDFLQQHAKLEDVAPAATT